MAMNFVGFNVNIQCDSGGFYQGTIKEVDSACQTITIEKPFHNGLRSSFSEITLSSNDILEITIIENLGNEDTKSDASFNNDFASTDNRPEPDNRKLQQQQQHQQRYSPVVNSPMKYQSYNRNSYSKRNQNNNGYNQQQQNYRSRNECFNVDTSEMNTDFDFEKNLALFDKLAVYEEMNNNNQMPSKTPRKSESKYRHDENVLRSGPVIYRQIVTKDNTKKKIPEYYTDDGLVIPTVSYEVNKNIMETAENLGLTKTRLIEIFGHNASQMALTMVGGSNRLNPRNAHQAPHIVVLCGPHDTGAKGVATARHLSNHNVNVCLFLADFVKITECLQGELRLLSLTTATLINKTTDLPNTPIDLVVLAMDSEDCLFLQQQSWHKSVVNWCNQTMAPVICLCPPSNQESSEIDTKWSVCDGLPYSLDSSYGSVYLLDIGLPTRVFQKVGIKYKSPFCSKTYIALHKNKT